jgi:hypothetical protein
MLRSIPSSGIPGDVTVDVPAAVGYVWSDADEVEDAREEIEIMIFRRLVVAPKTGSDPGPLRI